MSRRTFLSGANLVLPDRIESGQTLVIEAGRIAGFVSGPRDVGEGESWVALPGHFIVPGFIDVHVHGVAGVDVLDGPSAIPAIAATLPRYGITAFCPTSMACEPDQLSSFLSWVAAARVEAAPQSARTLTAHLESNFINAEYAGAQPVACLRGPAAGADVLDVIERQRQDIGIITMASELDGGLDLVRRFAGMRLRVSLGHSGATFDEAQAAIAAGATQATHLFNRMPRMTHHEPGLAGAVLASEEVAAEVIGDGQHVHPAFVRMAIAAKGRSRVMAITDGTAGSGLPAGARTTLGGRPITVGDVARLDDGTTAGSVATMDRVFSCLVGRCGLDIREAAELCATTPAREMGLVDHGVIATGAAADLVVLDRHFSVVQTWVGGNLAFSGTSSPIQPSPSA